uniref:CSON003892 protein n=1 Tax=Culicoides sonorensis TaxID=179676 RepID=A0A336MNM2_CULSO
MKASCFLIARSGHVLKISSINCISFNIIANRIAGVYCLNFRDNVNAHLSKLTFSGSATYGTQLCKYKQTRGYAFSSTNSSRRINLRGLGTEVIDVVEARISRAIVSKEENTEDYSSFIKPNEKFNFNKSQVQYKKAPQHKL